MHPAMSVASHVIYHIIALLYTQSSSAMSLYTGWPHYRFRKRLNFVLVMNIHASFDASNDFIFLGSNCLALGGKVKGVFQP